MNKIKDFIVENSSGESSDEILEFGIEMVKLSGIAVIVAIIIAVIYDMLPEAFCLLIDIYRKIALSSYAMMYISFILFMLNFLLYGFYTNMLDKYIFFKENEQLKQQMNLYELQLKANLENDKKIKAIRHDMKHHIREINALADKGNVNIQYSGEMFVVGVVMYV